MATFTPPTAGSIRPTWLPDSTPMQQRLYRYFKPGDVKANVFVNSDGTVTTDYPVAIVGGTSNVSIAYPWNPGGSIAPVGTPQALWTGGECLPSGVPPPYESIYDVLNTSDPVQLITLPVYVVTWFRGLVSSYPHVSSQLAAILTAAGFGGYLS